MAASTIAPAQVVLGAPRVPLPYGLSSVLAPRADDSGRWFFGVQWETLTCEPANGLGELDCDPDEILGLPKQLGGLEAEFGEASAFTVYGHHTCSPIGTPQERATSLAEQHLVAREWARVEQALWTGDLGNTPNFDGANGYPSPTDVGSFALGDAWEAVSALEQEIAESYGSQGVMHMSRRIATILFDSGDLQKRGGQLFTPLDTPVVAGTGYGSDKIVVSPALFGYRSPIISSSDRPYDLLDRGQNNLYAIAERQYLIGFDPCGLAVATIEEGA